MDEIFVGEVIMKFGVADLIHFCDELMSNNYIVKLEKISGCQYQIDIYKKVNQE